MNLSRSHIPVRTQQYTPARARIHTSDSHTGRNDGEGGEDDVIECDEPLVVDGLPAPRTENRVPELWNGAYVCVCVRARADDSRQKGSEASQEG